MQTHFSLAQLADPEIKVADQILRNCVHCGFCTATCPTFLLLGDERDSPRGRIYMIKDMLENGRAADEAVVTHVDRCLSCLSCMTTCPSGVHYMHLVDHARAHIEKTYRRPLTDRAIRSLLKAVLPHRGRFRAAVMAGRMAKPFAPMLRKIPGVGKRMAAMLSLAPSRLQAPSPESRPGTYPATGERRARVALLGGCAPEVLGPDVNAVTVRLLNRLGVEVVRPDGEVCCGSLVHHMGDSDTSHQQAAHNINIWWKEMTAGGGKGLDAIIVTASGCGTTIKDYGFMFRNDPALADKAAAVSSVAKDITEFLATLGDLGPARDFGARRPKVAYHAACSMQHGQKIKDLPMKLLESVGFEVTGVPEGHICCGSAGTYNILQPELATQLRDRKVTAIESVAPDIIAAGNIGCITQIGSGTSTPIVHTVELIAWALGDDQATGAGKILQRFAVIA
jgi:glycolate oxidase iron-sulfur subunit